MSRIFISYGHEDLAVATELYDKLSSAGHQPWLNKENLTPGEYWSERIGDEIRKADFFILLLSRRSFTRRGYLQKEVRLALEVLEQIPTDQRFLIPVLLDNFEPSHPTLRQLHWLDLTQDRSAGLSRLVASLSGGKPAESVQSLADTRAVLPSDIGHHSAAPMKAVPSTRTTVVLEVLRTVEWGETTAWITPRAGAPHPTSTPISGSMWILGARRELRRGPDTSGPIPYITLPKVLTQGDSYDVTIQANVPVFLSFSFSRPHDTTAIRWRDIGEQTMVKRRCADPQPAKMSLLSEALVFGQLLASPGHSHTGYAIRSLREHKKPVSFSFNLQLADSKPSFSEHSTKVTLGEWVYRSQYGTGVLQGGRIVVGQTETSFADETALIYVDCPFNGGVSQGEVLPIDITVSCPMLWYCTAVRSNDSTAEPAFELITVE